MSTTQVIEAPDLPSTPPQRAIRDVRPVNGFDPTLHPQWDRHVLLEMDMVRRGAERFRAELKEAEGRDQMTMLRPHSRLLKTWFKPLSEGIQKFLDRKARGPVPTALLRLKEADIPVTDLATIVLVTVLDRLVVGKRITVANLAELLGSDIDYERRVRWWERENKDHYGIIKARTKRNHSTPEHIRRVNIHEMNNWLETFDGERIPEWSREDKRSVGLQLIDHIIRYTKQFILGDDPHHRAKRTKGGKAMRSPALCLLPTNELLQWLSEAMDMEEVVRPQYLPTLVPPKPWTSPRSGGYWTSVVRTPFLIRFKPANEHVKARAIDDMMAYDMPKVYKAINYIQKTSWQINGPVLEVAKYLWDKDLGVAGLPVRRHEELPPRPPGIDDEDGTVLKQWKREAAGVYSRNARSFSRSISTKQCLDVADLFAKEAKFYFPHLLDFRGRCYPIPSGLSPQGADLARGLLTFGDTTLVDESSGDETWLHINVANTYGEDKVTFDERVDWVLANSELVIATARSPLEDRRWMGADKPFQFLAACKEMLRWWERDVNEPFYSGLPIHIDGTCNGIQHLAAMVRDEVAAPLVNLVPNDRPQDIYRTVAETLQPVLEGLQKEGNSWADKWLKAVGGTIPRSLTKRPVMILPYGGSRQAYRKYIEEWIVDNDPSERYFTREERWHGAQWLVGHMWSAVMQHTKRAQEVMEWLKACAKVSFAKDMPLTWQTPCGFVVRHFYGLPKLVQVEQKLNGKRHRVSFIERAEEIATREQLNGISPNFVHSMDASALMLCALRAQEDGIPGMAVIHDSFGCSAGALAPLAHHLRAAFVENYQTDVLAHFKAIVEEFVNNPGGCPVVPSQGSLILEDVERADYFFA